MSPAAAHKICSRCKVLKPRSEFYQTTLMSGPKTGHRKIHSQCKLCVREVSKVGARTCSKCGILKPTGGFKQFGRKICLACLSSVPNEQVCTKCKLLKASSHFGFRGALLNSWCRECYATNACRRRKEDPLRARATYLKWSRAHPDRARAATKKWIDENYEKNRTTRRAYVTRKYQEDPAFKMAHYLGCRLRAALKRTSTRKCAKTFDLLGCGIEELRGRLEQNFKPGMTWENYGPVWHVDHIKPCAKFDLTDPAQQRACFHYTNLQPLFALENIKKSDKYED